VREKHFCLNNSKERQPSKESSKDGGRSLPTFEGRFEPSRNNPSRTSLVPVRIALYLNLAAAQVKVCEATNDKLFAKHALVNCNKACSLAVLFSIQLLMRS
jgi:hypothetical protein